MDKNYLIIGGSGFIGTHYMRYVKNKRPKSRFINIDFKKEEKTLSDKHINWDIRKPIPTENLGKDKIDAIVNLAALAKIPGYEKHEYFETNVLDAKHGCDIAREKGIETILFTSTMSTFGPDEHEKKETTLQMPADPYGASKVQGEYINRLWQAEAPEKRTLIIIRPGVVYGTGENGNFTRLYKAISKGAFFFPGRKDTRKACIYVKDLVKVMSEMVEDFGPGVHIFNAAYFPPPTIGEISETMATVCGLRKPKLVIPAKLLLFVAGTLNNLGSMVGLRLNGIHPDRVKKLMTSTNMSGEKLKDSPYEFDFTLKSSIEDWYIECNKKGLY